MSENDLPDLIKRWKKKNPKKDTDRKDKAFFVPVKDIRDNKYGLSIPGQTDMNLLTFWTLMEAPQHIMYCKQMGFVEVGNSHFMILNPSYKQPSLDDIAAVDSIA